MPLQSGSDKILKAMNRNYRRERYLGIIEALKVRVPDIAITTDIIVGFPGETDEDFRQTLEVMNTVQFDNSYSYAFSVRPGTLAEQMPETISQEQKLERLQELQALQERITSARLEAWIGRDAEVLIDNHNQNVAGCMQGRISQSFMVNFDKPYEGMALGTTVKARITGRKRFTLAGEVVPV
jgi:tRNA-2-methylthio-N6-dimethylallyladenosine synthase